MTANGRVLTLSTAAPTTALKTTLTDLHRRFGDFSIIRLGDSPHLRTDAISTGFPSLDAALGVGGLPRGRITDIYGPEGSGKTTLCLHAIANAQRRGGLAVFIDTEHALDPGHAANCGVDIQDLYISQPDCGEQALEIAEATIRAGAAVVAIDSAASLTPRAEIDGEMGDNHAGLQARLMSQALRKLAGPVRQKGTVLIFTNQVRMDSATGRETSTGGMALRFHASVRLDLRRVRALKQAGEVAGCRVRAVVKKNKVAPPYRSAEIDIFYERGARQ